MHQATDKSSTRVLNIRIVYINMLVLDIRIHPDSDNKKKTIVSNI